MKIFIDHNLLIDTILPLSLTNLSSAIMSLGVTEYDEWDHIVRIAMLALFQYVMRNWRSSTTVTLGTDVTLHTTSSLQFCPSHIGHTLM